MRYAEIIISPCVRPCVCMSCEPLLYRIWNGRVGRVVCAGACARERRISRATRLFDFSIFRFFVRVCRAVHTAFMEHHLPSRALRLRLLHLHLSRRSSSCTRVLVVYSTLLVALFAAAKYDRFRLTRRGSTDLVAARACTSWCAAVCHREAADLHVLALEQQQRQRHQRQ